MADTGTDAEDSESDDEEDAEEEVGNKQSGDQILALKSDVKNEEDEAEEEQMVSTLGVEERMRVYEERKREESELEWQIELRKRNRLVAEDKERQKKERERMKNVRDLEGFEEFRLLSDIIRPNFVTSLSKSSYSIVRSFNDHKKKGFTVGRFRKLAEYKAYTDNLSLWMTKQKRPRSPVLDGASTTRGRGGRGRGGRGVALQPRASGGGGWGSAVCDRTSDHNAPQDGTPGREAKDDEMSGRDAHGDGTPGRDGRDAPGAETHNRNAPLVERQDGTGKRSKERGETRRRGSAAGFVCVCFFLQILKCICCNCRSF
jgi:hypothetical protein